MTPDLPSPRPSGKALQRAALGLGILCVAAIFFWPNVPALSVEAQRLLAVTVLMAVLWVLQPIPIAATSLIPLAAYPFLGILDANSTSQAYAGHNVFLFLGGFLIALAIERWDLHRRIALHVISRLGSSPRMIIVGFMLASALLSMWISNSACALLMMPIGLALVRTLQESLEADEHSRADAQRLSAALSVPLLLGIAYAANCGGFATLVGTPTNVIFRDYWEKHFVNQGYPDLSFAEWMLLFTPVAAALVTAAALIMTWHLPKFPRSASMTREFFRDRLQSLGPATRAQKRVFVIFGITAVLWILRTPLVLGDTTLLPGWPSLLVRALSLLHISADSLPDMVEDSTIAMAMALLLFVIPGDSESSAASAPVPRLMNWEDAERGVPWGMLLLIGGGFAMAKAFSATHLADWCGERSAEMLQSQPTWVVIVGVCLMLTFLTEFTTNVATVNTLLPILGAMAVSLKIDPRLIMLPATVSASCAFMLPIATPPNAIVFATGQIPMSKMIKYGFLLNLMGVVLVSAAMWYLAPLVMGLHVDSLSGNAVP